MSHPLKLGTPVRITKACALDVGTVGIITWHSVKHAAVLVSDQELSARVPLDAIEVAS